MTEQPPTPIVESVPARVGILGNPSDSYGGRTLAMTLPELRATVTLQPNDRLEIEPAAGEQGWSSVAELVEDIDRNGYGGGQRLLAATVRTFADVIKALNQRTNQPTNQRTNQPTNQRTNQSEPVRPFIAGAFKLEYQTTIPRQVGLAGSSALVIACLRCLCRFTNTELPDEILATIALRVETEQLGITAGLQDRVVQAHDGLLSMDFSQMKTDSRFGVSVGQYSRLDPEHLPPLFVSYRLSAAQESDVYHRELRRRYDNGDATVRETLRRLATLVVEGEAALRWKDPQKFAGLIAENMRLRRALAPLTENQLELVDAATGMGAHCTFTGSGGAIVGAYRDPDHFEEISSALASLDATTLNLSKGS